MAPPRCGTTTTTNTTSSNTTMLLLLFLQLLLGKLSQLPLWCWPFLLFLRLLLVTKEQLLLLVLLLKAPQLLPQHPSLLQQQLQPRNARTRGAHEG